MYEHQEVTVMLWTVYNKNSLYIPKRSINFQLMITRMCINAYKLYVGYIYIYFKQAWDFYHVIVNKGAARVKNHT